MSYFLTVQVFHSLKVIVHKFSFLSSEQEIYSKKGYCLVIHGSGLGTKSLLSCDHLNCMIVMTDLA
jgi:hypothetical protein